MREKRREERKSRSLTNATHITSLNKHTSSICSSLDDNIKVVHQYLPRKNDWMTDQYFSNCNVQRKHMSILLKDRVGSMGPRWVLRFGISNRLPGDAGTAGLWPHLHLMGEDYRLNQISTQVFFPSGKMFRLHIITFFSFQPSKHTPVLPPTQK